MHEKKRIKYSSAIFEIKINCMQIKIELKLSHKTIYTNTIYKLG